MIQSVIQLLTAVHLSVLDAIRGRDDRGQSMAEYALLILGVGLLAVFVFKWFQGSGLLEGLFSAVIGKLLP